MKKSFISSIELNKLKKENRMRRHLGNKATFAMVAIMIAVFMFSGYQTVAWAQGKAAEATSGEATAHQALKNPGEEGENGNTNGEISGENDITVDITAGTTFSSDTTISGKTIQGIVHVEDDTIVVFENCTFIGSEKDYTGEIGVSVSGDGVAVLKKATFILVEEKIDDNGASTTGEKRKLSFSNVFNGGKAGVNSSVTVTYPCEAEGLMVDGIDYNELLSVSAGDLYIDQDCDKVLTYTISFTPDDSGYNVTHSTTMEFEKNTLTFPTVLNVEEENAEPAIMYTTEHYIEKLDGTFTLKEDATDEFEGTEGEIITAEAKNFKGFTFDGNIEGTVQTASLRTGTVLKLYYTRNSYKVIYKYTGGTIPDGAEEQLPGEAEYKYEKEVPAAPMPEVTGYSFSGWEGEVGTMPVENVMVTGSWDIKKHTVTWANYDGTVLEIDEKVPYGTKPEYDGTGPERKSDGKYSYIFTGWNPEIADVTKNVKYTAQYKAKTISGKKISINGAKVVLSASSFRYSDKVCRPSIRTIKGLKLKAGTDYIARWSDSSSRNAGIYTVMITGRGKYTGSAKAVYKILKAPNTLKVKGKTAAVKYKVLKNENVSLKVGKVIKFTKKGRGKMSYKLSSAKKDMKSFKKHFKINKTTGKVTVMKGLKKGTYKVKVKVKAAGNSNYKASAVKTVTFTVKVK